MSFPRGLDVFFSLAANTITFDTSKYGYGTPPILIDFRSDYRYSASNNVVPLRNWPFDSHRQDLLRVYKPDCRIQY